MNVTPDALAQRLGAGLAPSVLDDERLRDLAVELGREVLDYGVSVLPRELFEGRSGADIAALVAEDLEATLWMQPLLEPRRVERTVARAASGDETSVAAGAAEPAAEAADATPAEETVVELVPPRVVELGSGWGVTAFVLAHHRPDLQVELVEPSRERLWWWRRLTSLHRLHNFRVVHQSHEDFVARNEGAVDVALVKRLDPDAALDLAVPLLREGGRVLSFQTRDRAAEVRKPRSTETGLPVRLENSLDFESAAARGRTVLCVRVEAAVLDENVPSA